MTPDPVNSPEHYTTGGIETIDYLKAKLTPEQFKGFCLGNALKYLSRAEKKNGVEDLLKAHWYIERLIKSEVHEKINGPEPYRDIDGGPSILSTPIPSSLHP